jgi:hypothetical protein
MGPVPVEQVRAWMTDAFLAAVLTNGTDITKVVHLGRRPTALQTTAFVRQGGLRPPSHNPPSPALAPDPA